MHHLRLTDVAQASKSGKLTLQLGGSKPSLGSAQSKMSSESTNSKSQSDSGPRGQKRPALPLDNHDQSQKAAKQSSKPSSSVSSLTEKEANDTTAWEVALQLREVRLAGEASRLREETRVLYKDRGYLEAQETFQTRMAEEREQHRKSIEEKDATIRSMKVRMTTLEGDIAYQKGLNVLARMERDEAGQQLKGIKDALDREKAVASKAEAELAKVKDKNQKGCALARDVRYWDKNRRAERYSQAGKYEQDAVRAAKEFDCGCATCEKRG